MALPKQAPKKAALKKRLKRYPKRPKKTFAELERQHGKLILERSSAGRFIIRRYKPTTGSLEYLGMLHSDGTYKEKTDQGTTTARIVAQLPPVAQETFARLEEQHGRLAVYPSGTSSFQVRKQGTHIGMFRRDGSFKEKTSRSISTKVKGVEPSRASAEIPDAVARDLVQKGLESGVQKALGVRKNPLPEAVQAASSKLKEKYGCVSVSKQKIGPNYRAESRGTYLGTITPEGLFKPKSVNALSQLRRTKEKTSSEIKSNGSDFAAVIRPLPAPSLTRILTSADDVVNIPQAVQDQFGIGIPSPKGYWVNIESGKPTLWGTAQAARRLAKMKSEKQGQLPIRAEAIAAGLGRYIQAWEEDGYSYNVMLVKIGVKRLQPKRRTA